MSQRELLKELDETIDQLIENAAAIEILENSEEMSLERDLLKQTQESLLAHLFHIDQKIVKKDSTVCDVKKIKEFSFEHLESLNCHDMIKKDKIKLGKHRLKAKCSK